VRRERAVISTLTGHSGMVGDLGRATSVPGDWRWMIWSVWLRTPDSCDDAPLPRPMTRQGPTTAGRVGQHGASGMLPGRRSGVSWPARRCPYPPASGDCRPDANRQVGVMARW